MVLVHGPEKERGLVSTKSRSFTAEKEEETVLLFGFFMLFAFCPVAVQH